MHNTYQCKLFDLVNIHHEIKKFSTPQFSLPFFLALQRSIYVAASAMDGAERAPWPFGLRHYSPHTFSATPDPRLTRLDPHSHALLAATPECMVFHITSVLDYGLITDFFLTYRAFLPASNLLELLFGRLAFAFTNDDNDDDDNDSRQIAVRTFVALRHWILNFFADDFVPSLTLRVQAAQILNSMASWDVVQTDQGYAMIVEQLRQSWMHCSNLYWDIDTSGPCCPGGIVGAELTQHGALMNKYRPLKTMSELQGKGSIEEMLNGEESMEIYSLINPQVVIAPPTPQALKKIEPYMIKPRKSSSILNAFTTFKAKRLPRGTRGLFAKKFPKFSVEPASVVQESTTVQGIDALTARAMEQLRVFKDTPVTATTTLFDTPSQDLESVSSINHEHTQVYNPKAEPTTPTRPQFSSSLSLSPPSPVTTSTEPRAALSKAFTDAMAELSRINNDDHPGPGSDSALDTALAKLEGTFASTPAPKDPVEQLSIANLYLNDNDYGDNRPGAGEPGIGLGVRFPNLGTSSSLFSAAFRTPTKHNKKATAAAEEETATPASSPKPWFAGVTHTSFLLSYSSRHIANQLTLIEREALAGIDWLELLSYPSGGNCHRRAVHSYPPPPEITTWDEYLRQHGGVASSTINLVVSRFNLMVAFLKSQLLLSPVATGARAQLASKLIHVAAHTRALRNFPSTVQIVLALCSLELGPSGGGGIWGDGAATGVSTADLATFRELERLVSPVQNFGLLRREMDYGGCGKGSAAGTDQSASTSTSASAKSRGPCVPFLGVVLADLTANAERPIHIPVARGGGSGGHTSSTDGNSKKEPVLVNFERFRTAAQILKQVLASVEGTPSTPTSTSKEKTDTAADPQGIVMDPELVVKLVYVASLTADEMKSLYWP